MPCLGAYLFCILLSWQCMHRYAFALAARPVSYKDGAVGGLGVYNPMVGSIAPLCVIVMPTYTTRSFLAQTPVCC